MSRYDVNVLLYRLKKDPAFRDRFRRDPTDALRAAELSDDERVRRRRGERVPHFAHDGDQRLDHLPAVRPDVLAVVVGVEHVRHGRRIDDPAHPVLPRPEGRLMMRPATPPVDRIVREPTEAGLPRQKARHQW